MTKPVFEVPDHIELLPGTTGRVVRRTEAGALLSFDSESIAIAERVISKQGKRPSDQEIDALALDLSKFRD